MVSADKGSDDVVAKLRSFRGKLTADAEHRFNAVYASGDVTETGELGLEGDALARAPTRANPTHHGGPRTMARCRENDAQSLGAAEDGGAATSDTATRPFDSSTTPTSPSTTPQPSASSRTSRSSASIGSRAGLSRVGFRTCRSEPGRRVLRCAAQGSSNCLFRAQSFGANRSKSMKSCIRPRAPRIADSISITASELSLDATRRIRP